MTAVLHYKIAGFTAKLSWHNFSRSNIAVVNAKLRNCEIAVVTAKNIYNIGPACVKCLTFLGCKSLMVVRKTQTIKPGVIIESFPEAVTSTPLRPDTES